MVNNCEYLHLVNFIQVFLDYVIWDMLPFDLILKKLLLIY